MIALDSAPTRILRFSDPSSTERPLALTARAMAKAPKGITQDTTDRPKPPDAALDVATLGVCVGLSSSIQPTFHEINVPCRPAFADPAQSSDRPSPRAP